MAAHGERSVEEFLLEAEQAADGRLDLAAFVASLDWSLPRIAQRGGDFAPQCVGLIEDALDRVGTMGSDLSPRAIRALAGAAATAARQGHEPTSVGAVHTLLVSAGLALGSPPNPRGRTIIHSSGRIGGGSAGPPDETVEPPDPALDPEIARLTRRVAPRRGAYQSLSLLGLGWAVALSIVLGLVAGLWLDGQFGTSPLLTIAGIILGVVGAAVVFRELLRQSRS